MSASENTRQTLPAAFSAESYSISQQPCTIRDLYIVSKVREAEAEADNLPHQPTLRLPSDTFLLFCLLLTPNEL